MLDLITNKLFRKWLTIFLKRTAKRYPETFMLMLDDLDLKPLAKRVIKDRYINGLKWEAIDYVDIRTSMNYHKIFLDKFIGHQK